MTIAELNAKYTKEELTQFPGNRNFRHKIFSPLFENLYENKIVYCEHLVTFLVKLENIEISPEKFEADAINLCLIGDRRSVQRGRITSLKKWGLGSIWDGMLLVDNYLCAPYVSWRIWVDPELVKKVEKYTLDNNFDEALKLCLPESDFT